MIKISKFIWVVLHKTKHASKSVMSVQAKKGEQRKIEISVRGYNEVWRVGNRGSLKGTIHR